MPAPTRRVGAGLLLVFFLTVALFSWHDGPVLLVCLAAVTPAAVVMTFAVHWLDRRNQPASTAPGPWTSAPLSPECSKQCG
ncbi:hypothetical protein [Microbacterium oxydans]|uniref:hypothetical protein n=1 Tax=Microbacterium oxydans TaxID=82380 RepID=UPI00366BD07C